MSVVVIIIAVIAVIWFIGTLAQKTGLDKKMHDIEAKTRQMAQDKKAEAHLTSAYNSEIDARMKIVAQKIEAVAKERGIPSEQASAELYNQCETHEKLLLSQGHTKLHAASQSFNKVFGEG